MLDVLIEVKCPTTFAAMFLLQLTAGRQGGAEVSTCQARRSWVYSPVPRSVFVEFACSSLCLHELFPATLAFSCSLKTCMFTYWGKSKLSLGAGCCLYFCLSVWPEDKLATCRGKNHRKITRYTSAKIWICAMIVCLDDKTIRLSENLCVLLLSTLLFEEAGELVDALTDYRDSAADNWDNWG